MLCVVMDGGRISTRITLSLCGMANSLCRLLKLTVDLLTKRSEKSTAGSRPTRWRDSVLCGVSSRNLYLKLPSKEYSDRRVISRESHFAFPAWQDGEKISVRRRRI